MPAGAQVAVFVPIVLGMAAEADRDHVVGLGEFPREVEGQPFVGLLHLVAVADLLAKDAVFVADAVADGRDVQRRQRIEEAGRQPPQTTVAQPRLHVLLDHARHGEL